MKAGLLLPDPCSYIVPTMRVVGTDEGGNLNHVQANLTSVYYFQFSLCILNQTHEHPIYVNSDSLKVGQKEKNVDQAYICKAVCMEAPKCTGIWRTQEQFHSLKMNQLYIGTMSKYSSDCSFFQHLFPPNIP